MAAEYLAATADQAVLCVEAVNPGLYAAVPSLAEAHCLRQQAYSALQTARLSQPAAELLVRFMTVPCAWSKSCTIPAALHACPLDYQGCHQSCAFMSCAFNPGQLH